MSNNNNKNTFYPYAKVNFAALIWYGDTDRDSCCLAENRLHRGEEMPTKFKRKKDKCHD